MTTDQKSPQTFEEWRNRHPEEWAYEPKREVIMERAFAAGVASQQARARRFDGDDRSHLTIQTVREMEHHYGARLAEKESELELRLQQLQDALFRLRRYEAVVDSARAVLKRCFMYQGEWGFKTHNDIRMGMSQPKRSAVNALDNALTALESDGA